MQVKCITTYIGHTQPITALCLFEEDSAANSVKKLITGSADKTIRIWYVFFLFKEGNS